jgi:hypothetical protein
MTDCENQEFSITKSDDALIELNAKGMQAPQKSGSASSYAKKYALGNLLLLDDTKDSDSMNTSTENVSNQKTNLETNSKQKINDPWN